METWLVILFIFTCQLSVQSAFRVGRGFADMTGLVAEGALYGYANPNQDARGLHTRQYSRAFVFEGDGGNRAALVITENCMISQALHNSIMERLEALYGDLYTAENVMLAPQHSHSTPGGFHDYYIYQIVSRGWINETTQAYIDGIVKSIEIAHNDLQDGNVYVNAGEVLDANVNRSPYSYDNNPEEEKDRYAYNVGKEMTILKLVSAVGDDLGMASIFPVHTTSMKNFNHLVSTDNKGYAAQMFEREMNPGVYPYDVSFVAGFAQGPLGDASPNTLGERCNGTDDFCSYNTSTCPENWEDPALCTGRGPANEQFEDTRIIGDHQYLAARDLYSRASELLDSVVDYRFAWVNMSDVVADIAGGTQEELCRPSMGYSFAAGATDGPGIYPFFQGMLQGIPELDDLVEAIFGLPQSLQDCQAPKPVLLPTGILDDSPWPWQPSIVPLQIIRVGSVVLVGVPGEITTMAGRRLGEAIKSELVANGFPDTTRAVVVGIANLYTSYIVTSDEYQVQRYEGASTIFGQYTLDGYITKFVELANAMATGAAVALGDSPPDLRGLPEPALDPILTDALEPGRNHGDILTDVETSYQTGETAFATFVSGNPRNGIKTDGTFLEVQRQEADSWTTVYTDVHWETKFIWLSNCQERPPFCFLPNITGCTPYNISEFRCWEEQFSNATVEWDIPANQEPGTYRLVHYGDARLANGSVTSYTGVSSSFDVTTARGPVTRRHSDEYYKGTGDEDALAQSGNLLEFLQLYFGDVTLSLLV